MGRFRLTYAGVVTVLVGCCWFALIPLELKSGKISPGQTTRSNTNAAATVTKGDPMFFVIVVGEAIIGAAVVGHGIRSMLSGDRM